MTVGILSIASMLIWIAVTQELGKPSEKQNNRKVMAFTALGMISIAVITISLFQNLLSN
ncbi:hypothetical protein [Planococcus sp. CPCC 101016]|uniref:hypothetical protein n=1 Tax=Planococcus sp. CPCC 101016 TaxID=2599617 RepID=UPI001645B258|nr:hypothetical protein [Planococcus sp. CPCC 101016]